MESPQDTADVLVAAGSLILSDGTPANVAKYYFANSTWSAVGSNLPGPVSAIRIDDYNLSSIFAAGRCVLVYDYIVANSAGYAGLRMGRIHLCFTGMALVGTLWVCAPLN